MSKICSLWQRQGWAGCLCRSRCWPMTRRTTSWTMSVPRISWRKQSISGLVPATADIRCIMPDTPVRSTHPGMCAWPLTMWPVPWPSMGSMRGSSPGKRPWMRWSVPMPLTWCRSEKMSESIRHLSATAAAAAVKRCRRQGSSAPCSPWPRPIIFPECP